jgi:hypothetical protein
MRSRFYLFHVGFNIKSSDVAGKTNLNCISHSHSKISILYICFFSTSSLSRLTHSPYSRLCCFVFLLIFFLSHLLFVWFGCIDSETNKRLWIMKNIKFQLENRYHTSMISIYIIHIKRVRVTRKKMEISLTEKIF